MGAADPFTTEMVSTTPGPANSPGPCASRSALVTFVRAAVTLPAKVAVAVSGTGAFVEPAVVGTVWVMFPGLIVVVGVGGPAGVPGAVAPVAPVVADTAAVGPTPVVDPLADAVPLPDPLAPALDADPVPAPVVEGPEDEPGCPVPPGTACAEVLTGAVLTAEVLLDVQPESASAPAPRTARRRCRADGAEGIMPGSRSWSGGSGGAPASIVPATGLVRWEVRETCTRIVASAR